MKIKQSNKAAIETLSAYLDGQLPDEKAQVVRQQLAEDTALRAQLDELRQARYVLKQTPRIKRRRSFVLMPEMVRQQRTFFRVMNVSRVISAVASVLLVVALGSQYLGIGGMGYSAAPLADMAESTNLEMADEVTAAEPMMMEAPEEMDGIAASAEEGEAPMDAVAEEPFAEPAEEEAEAPPAPAAEVDQPADDTQETQEPAGGGGLPPTATVESTQVLGAAESTATPDGEMRSLQLEKDANDVVEEGEGVPVEEEVLPTPMLIAEDEPLPDTRVSTLQIIQGVLLLLALAGGLTAAYFRKKVR